MHEADPSHQEKVMCRSVCITDTVNLRLPLLSYLSAAAVAQTETVQLIVAEYAIDAIYAPPCRGTFLSMAGVSKTLMPSATLAFKRPWFWISLALTPS